MKQQACAEMHTWTSLRLPDQGWCDCPWSGDLNAVSIMKSCCLQGNQVTWEAKHLERLRDDDGTCSTYTWFWMPCRWQRVTCKKLCSVGLPNLIFSWTLLLVVRLAKVCKPGRWLRDWLTIYLPTFLTESARHKYKSIVQICINGPQWNAAQSHYWTWRFGGYNVMFP